MPKSKKQKTNHHSNHQPYSSRKNHQANNARNAALSHEEIWDDSALLRSWDDAVKEYQFYHSIHARGEDVDEVLRKAEEADQAERLAFNSTRNSNGHDPNTSQHDRNLSSDEGEVSDHNDNTAATKTHHSTQASANYEIHRAACLKLLDAKKPYPTSTLTREEQLTSTCTWLETNMPDAEKIDYETRAMAATQWLNANVSDWDTDEEDEVDGVSKGANGRVVDGHVNNTGPDTNATVEGPVNINANATIPAAADQTLENVKMAYYWAGYYSGLYDGQRQSQGQKQ